MRRSKLSRLIYFIGPIALLATFGFVYNTFREEQRVKLAEEARIEAEEAAKAAEQQKALERKLEEEAKALREAKEKAAREQEAKAAAERKEKFDELNRRLNETQESVNRLLANVAEAEAKIKEVRANRIATEDQVFAMERELQEMRTRQSIAELETQRLTGMIADRFETQWKARIMPEVPTR
jgi:chromosome segregation ATPase